MLGSLFAALFALGLPVAVLSYFLLRWSYDSGLLDREATGKAHRAELRQLRRSTRRKDAPRGNLAHYKWLRFGGGSYGAAALWTLLVIEILDVIRLVFDWPGWAEVLSGGPVQWIVGFFGNQISNFVTAMVWFSFWSDETGGANTVFLFFLVIAAYMAGRHAAKAGVETLWPLGRTN